MARIRTIKPELFMDEELGVLTGDHALLFIGMLTQADREGRLEDRPARLKASLFPYRSVDVCALLNDLAVIGKVIRYVATDGTACLAIPGFKKHQRPHPKEPPSNLPEPCLETASREKKRQAVEGLSGIPSSPVGREGKEIWEGDLGREGNQKPPDPKLSPKEPPREPLREQLEAAFQRERASAYELTHRDEVALRGLLKHEPSEILRRWRNALRRTVYPVCSSLAELAQHWNHYATEQPANGKAALSREPSDEEFLRQTAHLEVDEQGNFRL